MTTLLKDHILIAADVITAAKAKDNAKVDSTSKRWFANADDIATFLSTVNPGHWKQVEMKSMMHDHLRLTTEEVKARLRGDWKADIAAYETVHDQILNMADMLSHGVMHKF